MGRFRKVLLLGLLLVLFGSIKSADAQFVTKRWDISLMGGIPFSKFNVGSVYVPFFDLNANYSFNKLFSLKSNIDIGEFRAAHKITWFGRTFYNHYYSFTLNPTINLTNIISNPAHRPIDLFGFAGVGFIHNHVQDKFVPKMSSHKYLNASLPYFAGKNNKNFAILYNLGVAARLHLTKRFSIISEFVYHWSTTDLLDGYPHVIKHGFSRYGFNNNAKDDYATLTAGVQFSFGKIPVRHHNNMNNGSIEGPMVIHNSTKAKPKPKPPVNPFRSDTTKPAVEHAAPKHIILMTIHFNFNKSNIGIPEAHKLAENVKKLRENSNLKVEIDAYTDYVGSDQYNVRLSERRAHSVEEFYIRNGIKASRIIAKGLGKAPVRCVHMDTFGPGCRKNRRAESHPIYPNKKY